MLQSNNHIVWKPVVGYEGIYEVSNIGDVKSLDRFVKNRFYQGKILKSKNNGTGYLRVELNLCGVAQNKYVHRLVAESFIGISKLPVDHINHNKTDNRVENLQYLTTRQNQSRRIIDKLNNTPVGVCYVQKRNKYRAQIVINKKRINLGTYNNVNDAHNAYLNKLNKL